MAPQHLKVSIPLVYNIFFLYVEPISILAGAFITFFLPSTYLEIVHASAAPSHDRSHITPAIQILLSQLTNVYVLFALNEALVLRSTSDLRVWRTMMKVLLLADFGHLGIVFGLGTDVRRTVGELSTVDWAKPVLFACLRIAFLLELGFGSSGAGNERPLHHLD